MLVQVSAPQVLPVSESEAWAHLRVPLMEAGSPIVEAPSDRADILRLIQAATDQLDGPEGILSRALIAQTWLLYLDGFPRVIELPLPPCRSVDSVRYLDGAGEWQTVDPAIYRVVGIGATAKAELSAAPGKRWPTPVTTRGAVEIAFTAGFGDGPEHVPAAIRAALCEIVAQRYAYRESAVMGSAASLPHSALKALDPWRVFV